MSRKTTLALFAAVFVLHAAAFGSAQAQVAIDVAKITCDQYVHAKVSTPTYIGAWLSGYYHGQRSSLTVDLQTLQASVNKLQDYCYMQENWNEPVLKAAEKIVGASK